MANGVDLSDDELSVLNAFRNGDPITRARIMLASMHLAHAPSPAEEQQIMFMSAYLQCNDIGRVHISKAMEMLASGKSNEEVNEYIAFSVASRPKAEVIDIAEFRPAQ